MRKTILMLFMTILLIPRLFAPLTEIERTYEEVQPPHPYKAMIYAIGMVECSLDTLAYNPAENAVGYFQIRPIRLNDYIRRTGSDYVLEDMYDYYKAEEVFLYYAEMLKETDLIIRKWNGSGPMTYEYLKKVKKYMI